MEPTITNTQYPQITMNIMNLIIILHVAHRRSTNFSNPTFQCTELPSGPKVVVILGFYCTPVFRLVVTRIHESAILVVFFLCV